MKYTCQTCGKSIEENFCSNCGEKKFERRDLSLKVIVGDFFNALTFVDNKFLKCIKLLFTKPGHLSIQYLEGKRVYYMKPIAIFFIANIVYFFFSRLNDFNPDLTNQLYYSPYGKYFTEYVDKKISNSNLTREEYAIKYNLKSESYSKTLIFLNVPMASMLLLFMFRGRRKYFIEHLIFSIHNYAVLLFVITFLPWPFILLDLQPPEILGQIILTMSIGIYLFFAMKRFYMLKNIRALLSGLYGLLTMWITLLTYKFFLFILALQTV